MQVAILFRPDPALGPDPLDAAKTPRRIGEFIDHEEDCIVIWRQWGEQFDGGSRTQLFSQGAWESVTLDQLEDALGILSDLPEGI